MVKHILIVEDEDDIRNFLKDYLVAEGFGVQAVSDGIEALNYLKNNDPDLVVLDLGLPKMSGESVVTDIRKKMPNLPVIILTARDSTSDVVKGLNLGADDYVTKPFEGEELLARIRARLRMNESTKSLLVDNLELDLTTFKAKRGDQEIHLTPQEFKLLEYLMLNRNHVLSRDMILNRIWPNSPDIETRVVDVYIGYLRKKVDQNFKKKLIQSMRGFGYMIKE